ncbi:ATP-dependent RNA helicase supv3l1, mitochondrial, partial [Haplosporangium bisporale]
AKLFNDPNSGYDVLVASDAIGMGLNLNIRRIIFEAVEKYDGSNVRALSLTQLKQIAGRAGRFGTDYAVGQATTLVQNDIPPLKRALAAPMIEIQRAAIQPTAEMLEQFSHQMPGAPFSHVLKTFERMSRNSDLFFSGLFRNMISTAEILDKVKLTIRERIPFISAPIQARDPIVVEASLKMAQA